MLRERERERERERICWGGSGVDIGWERESRETTKIREEM
jgi:hypothetical protein